jgi:hypothetical protein
MQAPVRGCTGAGIVDRGRASPDRGCTGATKKPPMPIAMVQIGKLDLALYLHTQTPPIVMIKDGDWGKALRGLFKPWTSTMLLAIYFHISCHTVVVIK